MTISNFNHAPCEAINLSRSNLTCIDSIRCQKITYIALASLGLGLAIGCCFVAPPVAVAFSLAGFMISMKMFHLYIVNNPGIVKETAQKAKDIGFKCLSLFNKKFALKVSKYLFHEPQISTAKKILNLALGIISAGLLVASFVVVAKLGFIFSVAVAGITLYKWLDYAYTHNPRNCIR